MKKLLYKLVALCLISMSISIEGHAQSEFITDIMGQPMMLKQFTDVKGSPYLYDDWKEGTVELMNGKAFTGVKLKYDQVDDQLLFQNSKGDALLFVEPVSKFEINERKFQKDYSTDGVSTGAIYEVLADGPVQLLKRSSKKVFEEVPYNSATKVKSIVQTDTYYLSVAKNASLVKLKKDKKSLVESLPAKKEEIEVFVKAQRLDLRQERDMAKLVTYYNSL